MQPYRRVILGVSVFVIHVVASVFLLLSVAIDPDPNVVAIILLFVLTFPLNLLGLVIWMFGGHGVFLPVILAVLNSAIWAWLACRFLPQRKFDPRLCIACGYDLRGGTANHCPECGKPMDSIQVTMLSRRTNEEEPEDVLASLMDEREQ